MLPRAFLALCLAFSAASAAENWPQFRGPLGDGASDATGLPVAFGEGDHVKWKTPVHGKAWSSPVVWQDQVWLTTANETGTELSVVRLDRATGRILRDDLLCRVESPQEAHRFNSYASPTPVIEEGRIYVTFGSPFTACLETATGKVLWQRTDLKCNHYRGAGSSPILWRDLLLMNFDGSDLQYIVALDKNTGATRWKTDRSVDFQDVDPATGRVKSDGDYRKAFATPHVADVHGQPILFSSGSKAHYAYDPATGRELWRLEERGQYSACTRPVLGGGLAYLLSGLPKGQLLAVKIPTLDPKAEAPRVLEESDLAYRVKKGMPSKPSLLLAEGLIFMIDDGGIASCLDAATGAELWRQRIQGNFSASPVLADKHIYVCSEEGKVAVFEAAREFNLLAENKLDDGILASPAIAGKSLFIRTKTALYCVEP